VVVFDKIKEAATAFDAWRPFPRLFIASYLYLLYMSFEWFTSLEDPTTQQASLISLLIGAGAAWFGLYVNSGNKK
jgi:hypothetical protein